jgi:hypothetical protein
VKGPRIIRTEIGEGLTTLVPYGVSIDVSEAARRLNAQFARLAKAYKDREREPKK